MSEAPSDPLPFDDSTEDISRVPDGPPRPLDPVTPGGAERFLTFHTTQGQPLSPMEPIVPPENISWNARYKLGKLLGRGSQGVVYLAKREGVDGYFTHVALKLFYKGTEQTPEKYAAEMQRIAAQARRVSQIQHDNLVAIRDFVSIAETRVMVLEWVDGLDLARLLEPGRFANLRKKLSKQAWDRLNDVVVTSGEDHCRLKPGIAVDVLRGCLAGLSALHQKGIVHCDLKPSNIMIKRTGTKKLIDIDSSAAPADDPPQFRGTPYYMAPEQLRGQHVQLHSDIASLGYILIEMLTGRLLFRDCQTIADLIDAKLKLPARLEQVLPPEVRKSATLRGLVSKMVAVEPKDRFPHADAAELAPTGAVSFQKQLVKMDLETEYPRELAWWLELMSRGEKDAASP